MEATKPKESTEITKSKEKEPSELEESKETTESKEPSELEETTDFKVESIETTESSDDNTTSSPWQIIWDSNTQMYYYWNMVTNETSWEVPTDKSYWEWQYNNDNSDISNKKATNENNNDDNNNEATTNNNNSSTTEVSTATTATAITTTEGGEYTPQEYYQYDYSQYGYYPEGSYYGYDTSAYPSNEITTTSTEDSSNPLESLLDKIDTEVKSKLDGKSASPSIASYPKSSTSSSTFDPYERESSSQVEGVDDSDYYSFLAQHGDNGGDYKLTARFNARTGKFQRDPNLTPEKFSAESKAFRQMSYFFDYDKFAEQRSKKVKLDESAEIKATKKLNKKDVEFFKQKKKEKKEMKKKAWLMGGE